MHHIPQPRTRKKGVDMFKWRRLGWCRHFAYTNECRHMLRTSTRWSCSWCTAIVMASLAPAHGTGRAQCPGKPRSKGPANLFEATDHWAATDNLLQTRHGEPPCTWYRRVTRNLRFVVLHWICGCVMVCIKRQFTTYTCPRVYHTHMPQNRYSNRKIMIHNMLYSIKNWPAQNPTNPKDSQGHCLQGWQLQRALLQTALKSRTNKGIFHEIAASKVRQGTTNRYATDHTASHWLVVSPA